MERQALPRTIGVIGGGTAGYFAALALRRRFPEIEVTVVESSQIPIIGVGEATTTLMPPFLHGQLGIDVASLYEKVGPTFKLGIRFEWGLPGDSFFEYPFGETDPANAFVHDRHLHAQSITSALMAEDRAPVLRGPDGDLLSLLPKVKFAYHLDNKPFVGFLAAEARARGIRHLDRRIEGATTRPGGGIDALLTDQGELRFDFYVDATGFRSQLIEKTLGSPFLSYASSLFCDNAIVAQVPQPPGRIRPYTTAETMDAGWCWRIPVDGEDHRGYVNASSFIDLDRAVAEMRAKNPGMGEPWFVRFRSGRHRDFWIGNTASVGNAYGFVEPLESTALHMVIFEIAYLLAGLEALTAPCPSASPMALANEAIGEHWDDLRWFLAIHYRHNRRLDTPFWRAARAEVDDAGFAGVVGHFRQHGPWQPPPPRAGFRDPVFGWGGLQIMLLGQQVETEQPIASTLGREAWQARREQLATMVSRALPQKEAFDLLRATPALTRAFAHDAGSWVSGEAERVDRVIRRQVFERCGSPLA